MACHPSIQREVAVCLGLGRGRHLAGGAQSGEILKAGKLSISFFGFALGFRSGKNAPFGFGLVMNYIELGIVIDREKRRRSAGRNGDKARIPIDKAGYRLDM